MRWRQIVQHGGFQLWLCGVFLLLICWPFVTETAWITDPFNLFIYLFGAWALMIVALIVVSLAIRRGPR